MKIIGTIKYNMYLTENIMPIINPPGDGNCGYYAVAIGLIDIIKQELAENNNSPTLNNFNIKTDSNYQSNFFSEFDLANVTAENLMGLQKTLRALTAKAYLEQFSKEGDNSYLAVHKNLLKDNNLPKDQYILFDNLNETNEQAAAKLKLNGRWATAENLAVLCNYLDLNLAIKTQKYAALSEANGKPTITVVNQGNYHWQTEVKNAPVSSKKIYIANNSNTKKTVIEQTELYKSLFAQYNAGRYANYDQNNPYSKLAAELQDEEFANAGYKKNPK